MRERTAYRFWYALRVFIIAYPAKFVNPKILKNFKKDCQLDNPQKSVIIGKGISANGPAQRAVRRNSRAEEIAVHLMLTVISCYFYP